MVTGAFTGPSAMSGNDTGFATRSEIAFCAIAPPIEYSDVNPIKAASPTRNKAVVKARRLTINGWLRNRRRARSNDSRSLA
jgi:hypothetical protein